MSPAVVDSDGNSGEGTSVTVAGVGPTLSDTPKTKEKETMTDLGTKVNQCSFREQFGTIWQKMHLQHYKKE